MDRPGPKRKRLKRLDIGYADALPYIYHNVPKYKNFKLVLERDYYREKDSEKERDLEFNKYLKENNYTVSRRSIDRTINRTINIIKEIKKTNGKYFPITDSIDEIGKERLIHMVLDTYPDPTFFVGNLNNELDWTGELMDKVFCYKEFDEPDLKQIFRVKTNRDGVIYINYLPFTVEEYDKAIKSYIEKSSWKYLKECYNITKIDRVYSFKMTKNTSNKKRYSPNYIRSKKSHDRAYMKFRKYDLEIWCNDEVYPAIKTTYLPCYKRNEEKYTKQNRYYKANPDYIFYPMTSVMDFHYRLNRKKYWVCDERFTYNQWTYFFNFAHRQKWSDYQYEVTDDDVLIYNKTQGVKMVFVFEKPTVKDAKLAREWVKYYNRKFN